MQKYNWEVCVICIVVYRCCCCCHYHHRQLHIIITSTICHMFTFLFNPLESRGNYRATPNNMKLVHWPLLGGLLHLVQQGGDWAGPQPTQAPLRCTKCNSPPINVLSLLMVSVPITILSCNKIVRCCAVLMWALRVVVLSLKLCM